MGALLTLLTNGILGSLLDKGLEAYKLHIQGEISEAQLREKLREIVMQASQDAFRSQLEAMTAQYTSFLDALRTTKIVQRVWALWVTSQIMFLVWLEFGVPLISHYYGIHYPGVGMLDQWAYGGVLAALGGGPMIMKMTTPKIPDLPK